VISEIPIDDIILIIKQSNLLYISLGLIAFLVSQYISAERLFLILKSVNFNFSKLENNKLYLIGMFYNFFIPGGVGGDAYKIYHWNKKYNWSLKLLTAASLLDRGLGLSSIGIIIIGLSHTVLPVYFSNQIILIFVLLITLIVSTYIIVNKVFKSFSRVFIPSYLLAIAVQVFQCICVIFIMLGLNISIDHAVIYVFMFLISSMLSFLSFSGIGVREFIFMQGSLLLNYNLENGVAIGLMFTMLTAFISLFGIVFHLKLVKV
jgi:uncharacterized membrane protein YbhN (UPF0104 family)